MWKFLPGRILTVYFFSKIETYVTTRLLYGHLRYLSIRSAYICITEDKLIVVDQLPFYTYANS